MILEKKKQTPEVPAVLAILALYHLCDFLDNCVSELMMNIR